MEIEACLCPFFIFTNENVRFDILTLLAYFIISTELKALKVRLSGMYSITSIRSIASRNQIQLEIKYRPSVKHQEAASNCKIRRTITFRNRKRSSILKGHKSTIYSAAMPATNLKYCSKSAYLPERSIVTHHLNHNYERGAVRFIASFSFFTKTT